MYLIAQELQVEGIDSVSLPAYCCGSMVAPFIEAGFSVSFYERYEITNSKAILIMDYSILKKKRHYLLDSAVKQD